MEGFNRRLRMCCQALTSCSVEDLHGLELCAWGAETMVSRLEDAINAVTTRSLSCAMLERGDLA